MADNDHQHNDVPEQLPEASLMSHLLELRSRLLKAVGSVLGIFVCLLPFTQQVFEAVAHPLMSKLPKGATISVIVRGEEVLQAHHDTVVEAEDHLILFVTDRRQIPQVERLFRA